jgi:hypothetical protein
MAPSTHGEEDSSMASSLPEQYLNMAILIMTFGYKVLNSLGMLATIWATVVLQVGFSMIKQQDLVIAFVQSFRYMYYIYICTV